MQVAAAAPDTPRAFGLAPFVFVPTDGAVEGPAFSRMFRSLATVLVAGCIGWLARLWLHGALIAGPGLAWVAAGLVLMAWTWWSVMTSCTRVSADAVVQGWIWQKRMGLADMAFCKLLRVPGLDWLVAPRLYGRTLSGKFAVFYGASPALVAEFGRLSRELAAFRRM